MTKSHCFSIDNHQQTRRESTTDILSFTTVSEKRRYPGTNPNREANILYSEYIKSLKKLSESLEDAIGNLSMFMDE